MCWCWMSLWAMAPLAARGVLVLWTAAVQPGLICQVRFTVMPQKALGTWVCLYQPPVFPK